MCIVVDSLYTVLIRANMMTIIQSTKMLKTFMKAATRCNEIQVKKRKQYWYSDDILFAETCVFSSD